MQLPTLLLALCSVSACCAAAAKPKRALPHIISILQDDLGHFDSGIHNSAKVQWTRNITALAREGVVLSNHYTHWHCSPTRRSFLTGRLPIHHGEQLSGDQTDDIDLRMEWLPAKLQKAGYTTHWFGKWHTGFRSMNHLGARRGFNHTTGSFETGGPYSGPKHSMRWQAEHPIWTDKEWTDPAPKTCGFEDDGSDYSTTFSQRAPAAAAVAADMCGGASWLNDTSLPCGNGKTFPSSVTTPAGCCAACSADPDCTHWVFAGPQNGHTKTARCHIKAGKDDCATAHTGSTSGRKASPSPGPSPAPSGPTTCTNEYSTDLWGSMAVQAVQNHDLAVGPLYVHLCFQAVHTPYNQAPGDPTGDEYTGMLWRADIYVGQLVAVLRERGMWNNTLIVYAGDNGGVGSGNNFPLRGEVRACQHLCLHN